MGSPRPIQNASFVDALTGETLSFLNLQDDGESFLVRPSSSPIRIFTWFFKYNGFNDWENAIFQRARAWAVRDGDVFVAAVPEPSTLLLLFGLIPSLGFFVGEKAPAKFRLIDR